MTAMCKVFFYKLVKVTSLEFHTQKNCWGFQKFYFVIPKFARFSKPIKQFHSSIFRQPFNSEKNPLISLLSKKFETNFSIVQMNVVFERTPILCF